LPTIAGFEAVWMKFAHLPHERLFGFAHVEERLSWLGIAKEDHEVHRMTGVQRDADLRVVLEPADPRTVAGARIDDDVGPSLVVDRHPLRGNDAHQRVVDRPLELAPVDDRFVIEVETGGSPAFACSTKLFPRWRIVSQNRMDRCVASTGVAVPVGPHRGAGRRVRGESRDVVVGCGLGKPRVNCSRASSARFRNSSATLVAMSWLRASA
jgi:hypothetical protein